MMERKNINLTNEQIAAIQGISAKTRYDALEQVAKVLGVRTGQRATWASSRKTIIIDDTTHADITFSKGKVVRLEYYSTEDIFYQPLDIKGWKAPKANADDEAIKRLQKKLGAMLLPR